MLLINFYIYKTNYNVDKGMFGGNLANLLKPNSVKVIADDGELHIIIALELNINLNSENLKTSDALFVSNESSIVKKSNVETKENSPNWEIPDFGPTPKFEFGKKS